MNPIESFREWKRHSIVCMLFRFYWHMQEIEQITSEGKWKIEKCLDCKREISKVRIL